MTDPILHEAAFLTREDLAEEFSDLLMDAGVLSVSTEDADADSPDEKPLYGEPGLEPEVQAWTRTRLKLLYEAGFDVRGAVRAAAGCRLGTRHAGAVRARESERPSVDRTELE